MSDLDLYSVFAEFARTAGAAAAADRFMRSRPDLAGTFRKQFEDDLVHVDAGRPVIAAGRDAWYSGPADADLHWPALQREFDLSTERRAP